MTAIFDIGKTNKKLVVFDDELNVVYEKTTQLSDAADEDDFPCEDVEALTTWMRESFRELLRSHPFNITKLNFSGYGASFVHLDRFGKAVTPLYNYLKPFPAAFSRQFYSQYGSPERIAQETASPTLGHLNSGMQLYWLKYAKPDLFRRIAVSLHLPQYLSAAFTGYYFSDITSVGSHTQLWDFAKGQYHAWVTAEKLDNLLPSIVSANEHVHIQVEGHDIECGIGLHDSSAALIPYQKHFTEPFVLVSTGTWSIALNPFNHDGLTAADLRQDCLCYLSYEGNPVKASRLFLGHEHEEGVKQLAIQYHQPENYFAEMEFNPGYLERPVSGAAEAYHAFVQQLVNKQVQALNLVLTPAVHRVFVDGGFSRNKVFMSLLALQLPKLKVYAAAIPQASALGAALVVSPELAMKLDKHFVLNEYSLKGDQ